MPQSLLYFLPRTLTPNANESDCRPNDSSRKNTSGCYGCWHCDSCFDCPNDSCCASKSESGVCCCSDPAGETVLSEVVVHASLEEEDHLSNHEEEEGLEDGSNDQVVDREEEVHLDEDRVLAIADDPPCDA
jgi:hypothetical protein